MVQKSIVVVVLVLGYLVGSAEALEVVDSSGKVVGTLADGGIRVVRQEGGIAVAFSVFPSSFDGNVNGLSHETADCSGARYVAVLNVVRGAYITTSASGQADLAYYGADPLEVRHLQSLERFSPDGCHGAPDLGGGWCCDSSGRGAYFGDLLVGSAASFDLSGFTPPFTVQ